MIYKKFEWMLLTIGKIDNSEMIYKEADQINLSLNTDKLQNKTITLVFISIINFHNNLLIQDR
jgi:hypothetical protein